MRIWIIDHYSVPERYYPLIRQTVFARKLMELGHDVRIFSASTVHNSDINLIEGKELYRDEFSDGVNYTYVKCHGYKGNGIKRILNMEEFALKLPKVCDIYVDNEGKPDAILSCSMTLQACKQGIKIARKYDAKVVAQITDLWPETLVSYTNLSRNNPIIKYLRAIEKWIYVNADKLVFSMEGAYDYIKEQCWDNLIPKDKVHFINNGVDLEQFDYNFKNYTIKDDELDDSSKFKFVYTGSIRRVNNLGILLDAAKLVKDKSICFLIYGDGDELENLKNRVQKEKIENVYFKGKVEKKYIPYITSKADVNIAHFQASELVLKYGVSFNKMFDYMAAGKLIFSDFACKYNPAIMHGCGIDLDDESLEGIVKKIEEIISMSDVDRLRYGRNARMAVEAIYNFNAHAQKLNDLLK